MKRLKNIKEINGITLIALVITIVILIILASVAISISLNDEGLFNRAKHAKREMDNAKEQEESILDSYEEKIASIIGSNRGNLDSSDKIQEFTPSIVENGGLYLSIKSNATTKDNSEIQGYIFILNGEKVITQKEDICTFYDTTKGADYSVSVVAIDSKGDMKLSKKIEGKLNSKLKARYLVVEVFDHVGGNAAYINELEIYNGTEKQEYTVSNEIYDSSSKNGIPYPWNLTGKSDKTNLNDGEYSASNSTEAQKNVTAFLDKNNAGSAVGSEYFARFLIDMNEIKDITNIKMNIGGDYLSRTPKSLSVFVVPNTDYKSGREYDSTYTKNLMYRNNRNMLLCHTEEFSSVVTSPTWLDFYN